MENTREVIEKHKYKNFTVIIYKTNLDLFDYDIVDECMGNRIIYSSTTSWVNIASILKVTKSIIDIWINNVVDYTTALLSNYVDHEHHFTSEVITREVKSAVEKRFNVKPI